ncbi:MAG: leucine-rich repeat protein, partial [Clostridiales bacterium]|nr:leucine-rich repeat protein [Clostridiales bacterium]
CSKLTKVTIPKGVTTIGEYAFANCTGLTDVSIPVSVKTIGDFAFSKCSKLATLGITGYGLNSFGKRSFDGCSKLTHLNVPLSVTYIGDYAFNGCSGLVEVLITKTQHNNASTGAFSSVPSGAFNYQDYLPIGSDVTVGDFSYKVSYPAIDGTGTVDLISVGINLEKAVIPAVIEANHVKYKVTKISRWTSQFNNQRKLKYLVIGANVVSIDDEAFAGCPELVSVTGGARLRVIGTKAFERCPKLKVFNITSKTLWKIGPLAFNGDRALTTLNFKKTIKIVKSGVRNSLKGSSVKTVKVKKKKLKKYKKIFKKKIVGKKVKVKK